MVSPCALRTFGTAVQVRFSVGAIIGLCMCLLIWYPRRSRNLSGELWVKILYFIWLSDSSGAKSAPAVHCKKKHIFVSTMRHETHKPIIVSRAVNGVKNRFRRMQICSAILILRKLRQIWHRLSIYVNSI